jgi:hypothetical protein
MIFLKKNQGLTFFYDLENIFYLRNKEIENSL